MNRLIATLGTGRAVIIYGAGPSSEIGLPTWVQLSTLVAEEAAEALGKSLPAINDDIKRGRIQKALGDMERLLDKEEIEGQKFIAKIVCNALVDTNSEGELYKLMAKLPVNLYMTTNFDDVFERHLKNLSLIPAVYTNTRESMEEFNPASYDKNIFHVHGSIKHGAEVVNKNETTQLIN